MKILISGSTGLIGSALCSHLEKKGHTIKRLVRSFKDLSKENVYWAPEIGELKDAEIEGMDVIINLAGENIAGGRWSQKKKRAILRSRVDSTHLLCETIQRLSHPPKIFINASAVGFYGDRGDEILTEESLPGEGFLAEVCQKWEDSAKLCIESKCRVAFLRFGVILSTKGGALKQMLTPFKCYAGGVLGNGNQYMSWIHIADAIGIIEHLMNHVEEGGPYNVAAPNPVTNRVFTKTLGKILDRPTLIPVPAFLVKLIFGEMGEELLLGSTRVEVGKVLHLGYHYQFPDLEAALMDLITGEH